MADLIAAILSAVLGVVVGCYMSIWFLKRNWRHVTPISFDRVAEMSLTLRNASEQMRLDSDWFSLVLKQIYEDVKNADQTVHQLADVEDQLRKVLESYMATNLHDYLVLREPELVRSVSAKVANMISGVLATRSLQYRSEYVLLNSLDDVTFDINLQMDRIPDGRLRTAFIEAMAHTFPRGEGEKGIQVARNYYAERLDGEKLKGLLERIGTNVARLEWAGTAAIQRTGNTSRHWAATCSPTECA